MRAGKSRQVDTARAKNGKCEGDSICKSANLFWVLSSMKCKWRGVAKGEPEQIGMSKMAEGDLCLTNAMVCNRAVRESPKGVKCEGEGPLPVMARWIEHWPVNQRVTSSIPSQGTCLG